jgi:site-specific DNA recombinase
MAAGGIAMRQVRPDHVAIYIRWSTEDQGEGTTLEVQREACTAYMISQGWQMQPDLIYVDDGVSGGSLDRPSLSRLRAAVAAGQVDGVVVYKLDRLSRSVVDMVKLVLDEWEGHCFVKSAREPIDTVSQTGKLFFYQLMSFAEWERSVIRERTFAGKLRRAQEGRNPGISAAYGYRLGGSGLPVIEPAEAAVVELIFRLYLSGLGCMQIARRLAELGHPSPGGRTWSSGQISRLLSNPVYRGALVYGKQTTSRGRRRKSDQPHVVREGALPGIVDSATFSAVQAVKAGRPGLRRGQGSGRSLSSKSLLTGLLRCRCGHAYCGNGGSGPRSQYRYYYCAAAQSRGPDACDAGRIRQEELDGLVCQALLEHLGAPPVRRRLLEAVAGAVEQERREAAAALEASRRALERAAGAQARLRSLFLAGRLTAEELRELRADAGRQAAELKDRVATCEARLHAIAAAPLPTDPNRLPCWDHLTPQERKQLAACFIREITAYREKQSGALSCTIAWACAPGAPTSAAAPGGNGSPRSAPAPTA